MRDKEEVILGGNRFRVERVSERETRLIPEDDCWLLRHIDPRGRWPGADTED